ncbi:MAG: hypothetical protein ACRC11_19365 [Xenococcaceae cyanobacterium]
MSNEFFTSRLLTLSDDGALYLEETSESAPPHCPMPIARCPLPYQQ